jgi:threonine/homoserine/homoserine lactone efflux protein
MQTALIAISSFVLALSGALVPGPLLTLTVSQSLRRGFRAGPLIILGHAVLELGVVLIIVLQITPIVSGDSARFGIGLVGGILLVLMGAALLMDARRARISFVAESSAGGMHPVLTGIVGSISNPYWTIWWLTIGLGYLMSSLRIGIGGVIAFYAGHISADLAWYSLISYGVSRGRGMIGDRGYRALLGLCGLFLIIFGLWFVGAA